jgi:hypothetical protein
MVLDHLVVQQLGKENEEGDIDNMLLHGAAALYNTNADGTAETDIKYSSKDVDELIDKVEADAAAEAKALEEKGRQQASSGPSEEPEGKKKESMSFAFAKIWEADANRVHEMSDDEEDEDEAAQAEEWKAVLERVEQSRQEAMMAEMAQNKRKRRELAEIAMKHQFANGPHDGLQGGYGSDASQKATKRRGKKRKSGEGSDGDFALDPGHESASDSDPETGAADDSDLAMLQEQQDNGSVPLPRLTGAKRSRPPKVAKIPGPSNHAIAVPALPRLAGPHPPPHPLPPHTPTYAPISIDRAQREVRLAAMGLAKIEAAQQICQWLYHVLNNLSLRADLDTWAKMALPEVHPDERVAYYFQLAKTADEEMMRRGQVQYFTLSNISTTVLPLLQNGGSVIPNDWQYQPHPRRTELGARKSQASESRPAAQAQAGAENGASTGAKPSSSSPRTAKPSSEITCEFCHSRSHTLVACSRLPPRAQLDQVRERLIAASAAGASDPKASCRCAATFTPSAGSLYQDFKLDDIDRLIVLSQRQARLRKGEAGTSNGNATPPGPIAKPATAHQTLPARVIYIDDDEDNAKQEPGPSAKRARTDTSGTAVTACAICGMKASHLPASCPVVTSGPESIKE